MRRLLSSLILSLPLLLPLLLSTVSVAEAFTLPIIISSSTAKIHTKILHHPSSSSNNENNENGDAPTNNQRRKTIGALYSLPFIFGNKKQCANAATTTSIIGENNDNLLADFPMKRLKLPKGGLGREYVIIQVYINGNQGPYDFMLDSGLTTEMITPHLQQILSLNKSSGQTKQGLSAGQTGQTQSLIQLNDVSLCCTDDNNDKKQTFAIKGPLNAIVTDFPQEHIDPSHDPVEGMLGQEILQQFDIDFDFTANRLRLWKPHSVENVAKEAGLATIDAVVINETLLLGFRVVSSNAPRDSGNGNISSQPFLGLVDCGASFSVVNWEAARLLGLPPKDDPSWKGSPAVTGMGVDGRPQLLPTTKIQLSYVGNQLKNGSFEAPPSDFTPFKPVQMAVGDLPVFSQLLGDGRTPYKGPAGIIGLDILTQRRLILETSKTRQRRIYVGKK